LRDFTDGFFRLSLGSRLVSLGMLALAALMLLFAAVGGSAAP